MDRRTFLKTLTALGATVIIPTDLLAASPAQIDEAWTAASNIWGLYEVDEYGTLSCAKFVAPTLRRDLYGYCGPRDFAICDLDRHQDIVRSIQELYQDYLIVLKEPDLESEWNDIKETVEENWADFVSTASPRHRQAIDDIINAWLDAEPNWNQEWDDISKTGTAQGAAYHALVSENNKLLKGLGIVIVEGECPGSSYFAAELRIPVEDANLAARENGWNIRFIRESDTIGQG